MILGFLFKGNQFSINNVSSFLWQLHVNHVELFLSLHSWLAVISSEKLRRPLSKLLQSFIIDIGKPSLTKIKTDEQNYSKEDSNL